MGYGQTTVHEQQEGSAYNGHFESVCYHPLFLFNDHVYCPRVLGQWFDGIRFYAAASSPTRSRRTWAGLR